MDKLAAVREKFILSLQAKAEELESSLQKTIANNNSLENLHSLIHKIAGSAGFYGQQDVAALATEIDKVMGSAGNTVSEPMQVDIRRLINLMRNCDV